MKTLVLIRHAKSSWEDTRLSDHDRPLNKRGLRDAPFMAQMLYDKGLRPDLLLTSTANRAHTTSKIFADIFGIQHEAIDKRRDLYLCWHEDLELTVRSISDDYNTVFLFNHNPTIEHVANLYADNTIGAFPTCAVAHLRAEVDSWDAFLPQKTRLAAYYFPKQFK